MVQQVLEGTKQLLSPAGRWPEPDVQQQMLELAEAAVDADVGTAPIALECALKLAEQPTPSVAKRAVGLAAALVKNVMADALAVLDPVEARRKWTLVQKAGPAASDASFEASNEQLTQSLAGAAEREQAGWDAGRGSWQAHGGHQVPGAAGARLQRRRNSTKPRLLHARGGAALLPSTHTCCKCSR